MVARTCTREGEAAAGRIRAGLSREGQSRFLTRLVKADRVHTSLVLGALCRRRLLEARPLELRRRHGRRRLRVPAQRRHLGPCRFGIDVIDGHRRHTAPVVDAAREQADLLELAPRDRRAAEADAAPQVVGSARARERLRVACDVLRRASRRHRDVTVTLTLEIGGIFQYIY